MNWSKTETASLFILRRRLELRFSPVRILGHSMVGNGQSDNLRSNRQPISWHCFYELYALGSESRVHHPNINETPQCRSSDGGMTWSTPLSIGVWGLPSHLTRLNNGRLVMTYGHRRAPLGIHMRFSDDQSET
ncbi:MAG: glycoside hydrolase [Pirellula sp.]|nr:glycoside hydrolase [Pirellula sp.]